MLPKPQLGIGIERILIREPLRGPGAPRIGEHRPAPGMVDFLLRCVEAFELKVYPLEPVAGRAAAMQFWCWRTAREVFEQEGHPDSRAAADRLVDVIAFTDRRPAVDLSLEASSLWYPGPGEWPSMDALLAAATRSIGWHRAA